MSLLNVDAKGAQVELLTGYTFTNKLLAAEAVQMAGPQVAVVYQSSFRGLPNNKRLSVLGDAVLTKVLCGHWFSARDRHGKELNAGDWTTLRNDMLSNDSLARRGYDHGIDPFVYCNIGTIVSAKMIASTLEAIIGAVYQDGGDIAVLQVIEHLGFFEHRLLKGSILTSGTVLHLFFQMRSSTSLAIFSLLPLALAAPAPVPVAVSVPEITPAPTVEEVASATIEERQLIPGLLSGVLGLVGGLLKDVDSAVAAGNPSAVSSALVKIQPTAKPTAISQVLAHQSSIWASPTKTNIYGGIATQVANGLGPSLDGTLSTALNGGLPVGENSIKNNNKAVAGLYPKKDGTTDARYSVSEADLRAAIFIPSGFTYGQKTPVLFVPGTGAYGGTNFANNLRKLLTGQPYADPVWVNIPGAMLADAQLNAEYIAYAINYISAASAQSGVPAKIAVISWSQGGLDTQWVLKYWPSTRKIVQDFLPVSPDFHGTTLANALCLSANSEIGLPCDPSVIQQERTSNFVQQLRKNGGDKTFVPTTTFYSGLFDEIVEPQQGNAASAFLPAGLAPASNNEVQVICANQPGGSFYGHAGVLFNPLTYALIVDALKHPGTTGQVSRIDRQAVCANYAAPGLDLDDVLATSGLIPVAGVLLLAYPQKMLAEPPLKAYATY
ncbi:hypothetical protein E8E11_007882 [Didymella keratinophila]|nr:hypothetical protein E8E11_007882 [Didymella keratinophila]